MKMRLFTIAATVFLSAFSYSVQAQWTKVGYMVNGTDTVTGGNFKGYGSNMYSATDKGLFMSSDNGNNWTNITMNSSETVDEKITSVFVAANGDIYSGSSRSLFKSTNNGSSWSRISTIPDSLNYQDIAEAGGNIVVATTKASNYDVYYSSDAGATWTKATGLESSVKSFMLDGNTLYLGGTAKGVYKSTDNGQTWSLAGTGFPELAGIWSVVKSGNKLFANSISGRGLFASADNASTWANADTAVFKGFCQVFSIAATRNTIIASMDGACSGGVPIKISRDGGETWSGFMDGITSGFYPNVGVSASGNAFFTKKGKDVYRYMLATGLSENTVKNEIKIYPNPTQGKFSLTLSNSASQVQIINVLGEVIHSENINKRSNIDLELSESGIYFIRVVTDRGTYSQKLIVGH